MAAPAACPPRRDQAALQRGKGGHTIGAVTRLLRKRCNHVHRRHKCSAHHWNRVSPESRQPHARTCWRAYSKIARRDGDTTGRAAPGDGNGPIRLIWRSRTIHRYLRLSFVKLRGKHWPEVELPLPCFRHRQGPWKKEPHGHGPCHHASFKPEIPPRSSRLVAFYALRNALILAAVSGVCRSSPNFCSSQSTTAATSGKEARISALLARSELCG